MYMLTYFSFYVSKPDHLLVHAAFCYMNDSVKEMNTLDCRTKIITIHRVMLLARNILGICLAVLTFPYLSAETSFCHTRTILNVNWWVEWFWELFSFFLRILFITTFHKLIVQMRLRSVSQEASFSVETDLSEHLFCLLDHGMERGKGWEVDQLSFP